MRYPAAATGFRLDTGQDDEGHNEDLELPLFDMATIAAATDNFSLQNKIGEGGFGPVYKVNPRNSTLSWNASRSMH